MELIRGVLNLEPRHRGCAASIGNYDGVHLGHQAVIHQLHRRGAELNEPAIVITFEPHPQEFFLQQSAPTRLTTFREKLELFLELGVERVLCLRFNRKLADMTPESFIERILLEGLALKHLVVGDDFRFGKDRQGDFTTLVNYGERHGFGVERTDTYILGKERVSSTRVRTALANGQLDVAEKLLGRAYTISGRVAHGEKRGREWGFPTVNIYLRHSLPMTGIFVVEVSGLESGYIPGVANLGNRPSIDGARDLLEVHLLDFDRSVYGSRVAVRFLKKLREEERFDSLDALKSQIARDKVDAEQFFAQRH